MPTPQKMRCQVESIQAHGEQVYTLELKPERSLPRFQAGQFLHLAIDPYDPAGFWPESRVFSIASSPLQRDCLELTYAVKGTFTARMERELHPGSSAWIKLPYGEFIIAADRSKKPLVLFAGGTGITAFTAFLADPEPAQGASITLFYGARTRDLLIYRPQIEARQSRVNFLQTHYFIEQAGMPSPGELSGRISLETAWPLIPTPLQASYYLSGPPGMLQTLKEQLHSREVATDSIHVDAWE